MPPTHVRLLLSASSLRGLRCAPCARAGRRACAYVLTLGRRRYAVGERALTIAIKKGRQDLVKLLLDFKADLTTGGELGGSALHLASASGSARDGATDSNALVVQTLLENGADIAARNMVRAGPAGARASAWGYTVYRCLRMYGV